MTPASNVEKSEIKPIVSAVEMNKQNTSRTMRMAVPQAVTATRVILGGGAFFAACFHEARLAATLITLGAITDGIDGPLARKLQVSSEFGALFDYFADYVCYIVAPVALSLLLFKNPPGLGALMLLGLPLLAGALRYPRNTLYLKRQDFAKLGSPGLGTVIYAFFIVNLVFVNLGEIVGEVALPWIVLITTAVVSCLMVTSVRYMKLPKSKVLAVGLLLGLAIMPFVYSRILAGIALAAGFVYTFITPFFPKRRPKGVRAEKS